jgi:hypothetical protein
MATSSFPLTLTSELPITFRTPTGKDQRLSFANYDKTVGVPPEHIVALRCIEVINGYKLNSENYVETYDAMELEDFNYYFDVFAAMFLSDLDKRETAKDIAKKLLNGESIVGTPKKSPATVAIGKKEDLVN